MNRIFITTNTIINNFNSQCVFHSFIRYLNISKTNNELNNKYSLPTYNGLCITHGLE